MTAPKYLNEKRIKFLESEIRQMAANARFGDPYFSKIYEEKVSEIEKLKRIVASQND